MITLLPMSGRAKRAKTRNHSTPMKGCRIRFHCPPPSRLASQAIAGWKRASPESASRMKEMAETQWAAR